MWNISDLNRLNCIEYLIHLQIKSVFYKNILAEKGFACVLKKMLIYYDNFIRKNFFNCGFSAILYIFLQIVIMQKCSFWQNMAKR